MENLGGDIGTTLLHCRRNSESPDLVGNKNPQKQFQGQSLGQHRQLRSRVCVTPNPDSFMYHTHILLLAMGNRDIVESAILPVIYVLRRFQ